ncbi:hypothetical protein B7939_00650 [Eggerthia catenaformis]|nr:hypothetical protein B7939_00650 [Eggerthia catenaformis]
MSLFEKKETKEEKRVRKEKEALEKYNLNNLTDPDDINSVKKIVSELVGTGMLEFGISLKFGKPEEALKASYLRAIVEQNFIIIRQLDRISKNINK